MANSKFTRFNRNSRIFDIEGLTFRQEKNKYGETVNKYFTSETLFEEDGAASVPHQVVAIYRNNFSEEFLREYPDMPDHRYNVAIKMGEDDYAYVSAPAGMNEQFAEIMADQMLIREIQKGNCAIAAYHFTNKKGEDRYGLEFC